MVCANLNENASVVLLVFAVPQLDKNPRAMTNLRVDVTIRESYRLDLREEGAIDVGVCRVVEGRVGNQDQSLAIL